MEIVLFGQSAEEEIEPGGSRSCRGGQKGEREGELLVCRKCRRHERAKDPVHGGHLVNVLRI